MSSAEPAGRLIVVVPARNEAARIAACFSSLIDQEHSIRVFFSDNSSDDGTATVAHTFADRLDLSVRSTEPLGPSEHFVSAGRWALASVPHGEYFALLAGDDAWCPDFARTAAETLDHRPDCGVVFPSFVWREVGAVDRNLPAPTFVQPSGAARQRRALLLPDKRELANLVYGVYRRNAFEDLLAAWERGGEAFGSDYAAAWSVLGGHKAVPCPAAVGIRHVRPDADLIGRVDMSRDGTTGVVALGILYVKLNLRINLRIGAALKRAASEGECPSTLQVQLLRAPQWLGGSINYAGWALARTRRPG
jgi:glycosyltransferase involved in cell wall biosynthesis